MQRIGLVDSHLHLADFGPDIDLHSLISEACEAGVSHLVCNGTSEKDWLAVVELGNSQPEVIPCLGLHPWFIENRSRDWLTVLENLLRTNRCGVGEIGLDKLVDSYSSELQEEVFRSQLELARKYLRPVTIHCVKAWGQLMKILQDEEYLPSGFLLHSYSGSVDMIKPLAKMGAYFSFSGTVLIESHKRAREALQAVPSDRLLIESDSPYMIPPEHFRRITVLSDGKELNHPANLPEIMKGISGLLGVSPEILKESLWENSQRFYGQLF